MVWYQAVLQDPQRAFEERLRIGVSALVAVEQCQVVDDRGEFRMIRPEGFLVYADRAFEERFSLGVAALVLVEKLPPTYPERPCIGCFSRHLRATKLLSRPESAVRSGTDCDDHWEVRTWLENMIRGR